MSTKALLAKTADVIRVDFKSKQPRVLARIAEKTAPPSGPCGCMLWTGSVIQSNGYPTVYDGKKMVRPSRVLAAARLGRELQADEHVLHRPGVCSQNPLCMNPDHHYIGSRKQNMADAKLSGTLRGPKLTTELVDEIVVLIDAGGFAAFRDIAAQYGVTPSAIRNIAKGRTWGWHTQIKFEPKPPGRPRKGTATVTTAKRASVTARAVM
jgi:hypothetical protein